MLKSLSSETLWRELEIPAGSWLNPIPRDKEHLFRTGLTRFDNFLAMLVLLGSYRYDRIYNE